MIGVYIPLNCYNIIHHVDDKKIDVWKLEGETESEVGMEEKNEVRTDLRRSKSTRDKFEITRPHRDICRYFEKIHIGIGSMHVYERNDFMKEHIDRRLCDHDGLPHVMTLVVSDDMTPLRINGEIVCSSAVLFSLDCKHEVLPSYNKRRSFTFPVYGIYNPFYEYKQRRATGINLYDEILRHIDEENPESDELRPLIGVIDVLGIREKKLLQALHLFNSGYGIYDDEDPKIPLENTVETYINYTINGIAQKDRVTAKLVIPNATNITFEEKSMHPGYHVFDVLRRAVLREKEYTEAAYAKICRQEIKELPDDVMRTLPKYPVMIALIGRYFSDSTIDSLVPEDRAIYNLVSKTRKVSLSIAYEPSYKENFFVEFSDGEFVQTSNTMWHRRRDHLDISDISVEFDDSHKYDASFTWCRGVLIVD